MSLYALLSGLDELRVGKEVTFASPQDFVPPIRLASLIAQEAARAGLRCGRPKVIRKGAEVCIEGIDVKVIWQRKGTVWVVAWLRSAFLHADAGRAYQHGLRVVACVDLVPRVVVSPPFIAEVVLFADFQGTQARFGPETIKRLVGVSDDDIVLGRYGFTIMFRKDEKGAGLLYKKSVEIERHPRKGVVLQHWLRTGNYTSALPVWRLEFRFGVRDLRKLGLPDDLGSLFRLGLDRFNLRRRRGGDPERGGEDPVWRWLRTLSFPAPWGSAVPPRPPTEPPPTTEGQINALYGSIAAALGGLLAILAPGTRCRPRAIWEAYRALLEADPERADALAARVQKALLEAGVSPSSVLK